MMHNTTKVWAFIFMTSLALLITGHQLGERLGLLIGFAIAVLLNFFVFFYGETRVLSQLKAQRIKGQDAWGLNDLIAKYSDDLKMPPPGLFITPHNSANAFSVGFSWKRSAIVFTTGLLERFNPTELEAVVAHQLCHVRRLDTFSFSAASALANAVIGVGQVLDAFLPWKLQLFAPMLSPIGWLIIKLVVDEKSVFENDLLASELLESRGRIGEVLWRLEGLAQSMPLKAPPCTSHLFMVNPENYNQRNMFLKSHPAIEVRLKRLMGYYPI